MKKSFRKIFAILAVVTVLGAMCIPFAFAEGAASANYASEAVSALTMLGYSQSEAAVAVGKLSQDLSVEDMIKQALKQLSMI